jgi:F-type H+-transporting ATPase subunit delta
MAARKHSSPIAHVYARSILELANEKGAGAAESMGEELSQLLNIVRESPSYKAVLDDPAIGQADRRGLLDKVFRGRVSPLLMNFLGVLNEKGRLGLIEQIAEAYEELLDEQLGKVEVDVTVARRLSPEQLEIVRKKVSQALKKDAVIHQYVDENILGGIVLRVEDKLLDASARSQLRAMKERLLAAPMPEQMM